MPERGRGLFDLPELSRWLASAGDAAETARLLAGLGRHNDACFHAEQAAQLALKGLLHGLGLPAWGHDLVELARRCAAELAGMWPPETTSVLVRLSRHYIPTRYPDAQPGGTPAEHYGREDSAEALRQAQSVLGTVGLIARALAAPGEL